MKLVAIGGGEIADLETLPLDKEIVRLTGKRNPKALFIPTASGEPDGYIETFHKVYGKKLGCKTDVLFLVKNKPSMEEIRKKILSSDIVYVGGGNTLKMIGIWKRSGVYDALKEAYQKGVVLSGLSAGAICWFDYGHSDSMSFYHPKNWKYIKVSGLGFVDAICCPHFDSEGRKGGFLKFMKKTSCTGIAIDDNCAVEFVDGNYRVISSKATANSYKLYKENGNVIMEKLPKNKWIPISVLLEK